MAVAIPSDAAHEALIKSCKSAAELLTQHGQAIQQVLQTLQAALLATATAATAAAATGSAWEAIPEKKQGSVAETSSTAQHVCEGHEHGKRQSCSPDSPAAHPTPAAPGAPANSGAQPNQQGKGHGKGWKPFPAFHEEENETRYDGWTRGQWEIWLESSCGSQWCDNKHLEAERIADFLVESWGLETLQSGSGVIDVGGEPGFLSASLLQRGVPVTLVDPTWQETGKSNRHTKNIANSAKFSALATNFDEAFVALNAELVNDASAIVSLYGDDATAPCLQFAAEKGMPCAVMPCNECVRYYPPMNRNYDGYAQALLNDANARGGQFLRATLHGVPFSRVLIVQLPPSREGSKKRQQLELEMQQMQWQMQQMQLMRQMQMHQQQNQHQHPQQHHQHNHPQAWQHDWQQAHLQCHNHQTAQQGWQQNHQLQQQWQQLPQQQEEEEDRKKDEEQQDEKSKKKKKKQQQQQKASPPEQKPKQ